jgi:hypothetical protein
MGRHKAVSLQRGAHHGDPWRGTMQPVHDVELTSEPNRVARIVICLRSDINGTAGASFSEIGGSKWLQRYQGQTSPVSL